MIIAARLLTDPATAESPESLNSVLALHRAEIQATPGKSEIQNTAQLIEKLKQWHALDEKDYPIDSLNELAAFLSPETNGRAGVPPPLIFKSVQPPRGDYARYGIDLRVNSVGDSKKEDIIEDAQWFLRTAKRWADKSKSSAWFVSDARSPSWPADEFRFYDYKRDRLNRMIVGGVAASLGILTILLGAGLGGFDPPTWRQIFKDREFALAGTGRPQTPFNRDSALARTSNVWLWGIMGIVAVIQSLQCFERKELWAEGWINHPVSFIVILAFGLALAASSRPLVPAEDKEYFLEEHLNHFRQHNWCLLCIPVASLIVIVYSLGVLLPSDPVRAWVQVAVGIAFLTATARGLWLMARSASSISCREHKDSPQAEKIDLRKHLRDLLLPRLDHTLPLQLLTVLGTLLVTLTLGGI